MNWGTTVSTRWNKSLTIFFLFFLLFALLTAVRSSSWNDSSRLAQIQSLVDHGSLIIDDSVFSYTGDKYFFNQHFYSDKPPILAIYAFYNLGVTRLDCQRLEPTQVNCTHRQSRLLDLVPGVENTLSQVTTAEIKTKTSIDSRESTTDQWVVLQTSSGEINYLKDTVQFNDIEGTSKKLQPIANEINRFLTSNEDTLTLEHDHRLQMGHNLLPAAFMGMFVVVGTGVMYLSLQSETLIFDKTSQQFRCIRHTLLGQRTWQCPLQEIHDVAIDIHRSGKGLKNPPIPSNYSQRKARKPFDLAIVSFQQSKHGMKSSSFCSYPRRLTDRAASKLTTPFVNFYREFLNWVDRSRPD